MKREEGITLVALIITIVVMIILASVSIKSGTESLDITRLEGFYTQLELVQKRVDDIAATNESYIDSDGNIIYLKDTGKTLTDTQKTSLQNIITSENLEVDATNFQYFTVEDLENILDLSEIEYNLFIDFNSRIIVAEDGIKIGDKIYYVLKNVTYFVQQDIEKHKVQSLSYDATQYKTGKYKVTVTAINAAGDDVEGGYVKYKKTTTKYWEVSNNTEMILETSVEYNIVYVDANKNSIEKTIKVEVDSTTGEVTVTEI